MVVTVEVVVTAVGQVDIGGFVVVIFVEVGWVGQGGGASLVGGWLVVAVTGG